jgi:hypothetical protein
MNFISLATFLNPTVNKGLTAIQTYFDGAAIFKIEDIVNLQEEVFFSAFINIGTFIVKYHCSAEVVKGTKSPKGYTRFNLINIEARQARIYKLGE